MKKTKLLIIITAILCLMPGLYIGGSVIGEKHGASQIAQDRVQSALEHLGEQHVIFRDEQAKQIWVSTYEQLGMQGEIRKQAENNWFEAWLLPTYGLNLTLNEEQAVKEIERLYDGQLQSAANAYFKISYNNEITVMPERAGKQLVFTEILDDLITEARPQGPITVQLSSERAAPEIAAADLQDLHIEQLWGEFSTTFNGDDQKRTRNIWLASSQIEERILLPGEIFSFNEAVGPRTKEKGYGEAGVIINNQVAQDVGGGVCQVSTTLYNAACAAGLTIVELHHHTIPVHYVDPGKDAAVVYGNKDLRFKNDTTHAVLIKSYFAYGKLTIKIFGAKL